LSRGQTVTLIPDNQAITTQRAADFLGMSRPFFIKQLESGLMAHHRVGNQRRVYLRDVLEIAKKRDKERLAALELMARDAFEAGLYERNVFPEDGTDEWVVGQFQTDPLPTSEEYWSRSPRCLRPGPNTVG
jgi:excisionase family DNA binding protein